MKINEQTLLKIWTVIVTAILVFSGVVLAKNYVTKVMDESFQTVTEYGYQMGRLELNKAYNIGRNDTLTEIIKQAETGQVEINTEQGKIILVELLLGDK